MTERRAVTVAVIVFACLAACAVCVGPPAGYPVGTTITIPSGMSVSGASALLKANDVIQFPFIFYIATRLEGGSVFAGAYALDTKENAVSLAYRLTHGKTNVQTVKVTFPEGITVLQMSRILKKALPSFDAAMFVNLAKPDEGYLFPDTYFFSLAVQPADVIRKLKSTFAQKIASLHNQMGATGHSEADIITMASILEKEGRQPDTRRTIAGILWERLRLGMALQVDVVFAYIFNRDTYEPTLDDLKLKSPYNTYINTGLPPGPIGNPGLETIEDALTPIETPYLYYVTDKEGNIYYAKTFSEHLLNKKKARN